jgi:hypothetical protein
VSGFPQVPAKTAFCELTPVKSACHQRSTLTQNALPFLLVPVQPSAPPIRGSATNRQRGTASEVLGDHVSQYKRDIPYATLAHAFQPVPTV